MLEDLNEAVRAKAAADWHAWEAASLAGGPPARWADARYRQARARIIAHYFSNGAWLGDGELLANAPMLDGIPGELVHGQFDLEAPLATAWELAQKWRTSALAVVPGAAHALSDDALALALAATVARLRERIV